MNLLDPLKEKFLEGLSPKTMRSRLLWSSVASLARSPLNRPQWRADGISLSYFIQQTRLAYQQKKPVVWSNLLFPSELIHAAGAVPFYPEMAAAVISSLELASRFLEKASEEGISTDACAFHRVILGSYREGFLPEPQLIATVNYLCDSAPLSFQYVSLGEGVPHRVLEVPFEADASSLSTLASQLEELGAQMSALTGKKWREFLADLERALLLSNQAREYLLEVEGLRRKYPFILDGKDAMGHLSVFVSTFGHPAGIEFYRTLAEEIKLRAEKSASQAKQGKSLKRLLWMHLKPYYPSSLFSILEERGARIVCEEYNRCYWEEFDPSQPFFSLARKLSDHFAVGPVEKKVVKILQMAEEHQVDGVIHFNHWGCRQSTGSTAQVKEALRRRGIPFLALEGECIDEREYQEGQISTRLEAFLESL